MKSYPNIRKKTEGRLMVMMAILLLFGSNCLSGGIINLSGKNLEESTFLERKMEQAAQKGKTLDPEQIEYWTKQDRIQNEADREMALTFGVLWTVVGVFCLGSAVFIWYKGDLKRSKLGKMVGAYTAHLGEQNPEKALMELDTELSEPIYDSKQLALTRNWLIGHVGTTRKAVAFPISSITGVYYYYHIRRVHRGAFTQTHYFYQILVNDKFDKNYILQLKSKDQLDEVFPMVAAACSNADIGNYEDDFVNRYNALPKVEREAHIREVLRANQFAGMAYCEL